MKTKDSTTSDVGPEKCFKSDFDRLKELFESFDMEFHHGEFNRERVKTKEITIDAGDKKVKGYSRFFADFVFDEDGKFLNAGVWE